MATFTPRARRLRRPAFCALLALAISVLGLGFPLPGRAADGPVHFVVNDLAYNTRDANPGDGTCLTRGPFNRVCTLRAALEETNALAQRGNMEPTVITMAPNLTGTIHVQTILNINKMFVDDLPFSNDGAYFWVTAPNVTIDFGNQVGITSTALTANVAVIYADAPHLTVRNFRNLTSSETSIVASPNATGLHVHDGVFSSVHNAKRVLVPLNGASNLTLRDIHVANMRGDAIVELPSGASVSGLTLDRVTMDNGGGGSDHYRAISGLGSNTLTDLRINGSTFSNFKSGYNVLDFQNVTLDGAQIEDNRFLANASGGEGVIHIVPVPVGRPSVIRSNYFDNSAGDSAPRAINASMGMPVSATNLLSITDNYFAGFTANASIRLENVGTLTAERNRFGPPSYGAADETSEAGSNTLLHNATAAANGDIRTWYPTAVSQLPEQCAIDVTVEAPTSNVPVTPVTPVTLDAYFTASDDAEVYLGRVENVTQSPTTVHFPYGVGSGFLRLQTKDALGRSSQYSRVIAVTAPDSCAPAVQVEQAPGQADPTNRRDIRFVATFSEPVSAPGVEAFSLTGSTAPGARVTDVTKLDRQTYLVTVRVDGAGVAQLSLPEGVVTDDGGRPNQASTSKDNEVEFQTQLEVTPVNGTLTTSTCATYQITKKPSTAEGYPAPSASLSITLSPQIEGLATVTPNPAIIEPGQLATTVTVCAAPGAQIPIGTLPIGHTVSSADAAYNGLLLAEALVPMDDGSTHWSLGLVADPPSGQVVRADTVITYTATATHTWGPSADLSLVFNLAAALDDARWIAGSLTVTNNDQVDAVGAGPDEDGMLTVPKFILAPGTSATVQFQLSVLNPAAASGDAYVDVTLSPGASDPEPDACDPTCRESRHPIAAVAILKTGPATVKDGEVTETGAPAPEEHPTTVQPGEVTWAYTVTNIGAVPLTGLVVADDKGVPVTCPDTTLARGTEMVCYGTDDVG